MTEEEKSEVSTKCRQLKMKAQDGKMRETDTLDTEGILRLIESVPSSKAEPFKMWLAKLGSDKINETFAPSRCIDQMIDFYLKKGFTLEWIEARIKAIIDRKKLTNTWKENGVREGVEYAILTNDIYKEWSGMTAGEYKSYKGIRKENLRDNMTDLEVAITNIGELATREIARNEKPQGLNQNRNGLINNNYYNNQLNNIPQNINYNIKPINQLNNNIINPHHQNNINNNLNTNNPQTNIINPYYNVNNQNNINYVSGNIQNY
jgi:hypothetical protein